MDGMSVDVVRPVFASSSANLASWRLNSSHFMTQVRLDPTKRSSRSRLRALVESPDPDAQGNPGRRRRAQSPALCSGPGWSASLALAPTPTCRSGSGCSPRSSEDRPRRDGRRRRARTAHAGAPADRTLEGIGPVRDVRRAPDAAQDEQRPALRARADPRGSLHRYRPRPDPLVQTASRSRSTRSRPSSATSPAPGSGSCGPASS